MPRYLEETDIDPITEEVNVSLDMAEERQRLGGPPASTSTWNPQTHDLTDGGTLNHDGVNATLYPTRNGKRVNIGRATARKAWSWNGTESALPLAWSPEGKRHDGARAYLLKRHCICCHFGGFKAGLCPDCARHNCVKCKSGRDLATSNTLPNGRVIQGWIIPQFYLSREQVPFPARFYGSIDCFLPLCVRRGGRGFLTEEEMRVHATSRHRMEYKAYMETEQAKGVKEVDRLRAIVDNLLLMATKTQAPAPLYVSEKSEVPQRRRGRERRHEASK